MLKVTNESTKIDVQQLPISGAYYYTSPRTISILEMNESIADELISMIDSGSLDSYDMMSFNLYDFYAELSDFVAGFHKLFDYLIYDNQWFVEHTLSIMCSTKEMKDAIAEEIVASQRKITVLNEELFPQDIPEFIDVAEITTELRGSIVLSDKDVTTPLDAIRLESNLEREYIEIRETPDETKNQTDPAGIPAPVEGEEADPEAVVSDGFLHYYQLQYVQHHIVAMETEFSRARFYGDMSTSTREPCGYVYYDIYKIIKEEEVLWSLPEQAAIEEAHIAEGGEITLVSEDENATS